LILLQKQLAKVSVSENFYTPETESLILKGMLDFYCSDAAKRRASNGR
jgi:hypothetical protein